MSNTDALSVLVMGGLFVVLGYLGVPVAFAMMAGVLVTTILFTNVDPASMIGQMFEGLTSPTLLAIPFFLLVGEMMSTAGTSLRLVGFANALVGHLRSGLAHVVAVSSLIFSGISGSATADTVAIGRVMLPAMAAEGYAPGFSAALVATASAIANIVPPSILAIVYGSFGNVSIGGLFLAGVTPGVLICIGIMIYSHFYGPPGIKKQRASFLEVSEAAKRAALPLLIPFIIVGGILTGQFTPSEAGMVAVVYTICVLIPLTVRGHIRRLPTDFINAGVFYSLPMIAIAAASGFGWMIAYVHGQDVVAGWVSQFAGTNAIAILILVVIMFTFVADFLDQIPAIIIFMPIIMALQHLGNINPLQMAIVVIVTLAHGNVTPFYGTSLLIATTLAGVTFWHGVIKSLPLYVVFGIVIAVIVIFPDVTLWLPRLLIPQSVGCLPNPNGSGWICPH
jgi:C4-dicarboxylate transporter DctM subunit